MNKRTQPTSDLALEAEGAKHSLGKIRGYTATKTVLNGNRAITLGIDAAKANTAPSRKQASLALRAAINALLPSDFLRSNAPVTAICLGNSDFTADSLGPLCADKIIATRHLKRDAPMIFSALGSREISVLRADPASRSGIDALELAKMCVGVLGSKLLITVDSLKASSETHLYRTVQIACGITPGSGVGNDRPSLCEKTLGIPVISIGVPTAISVATLVADNNEVPHSIAPATVQNQKIRHASNRHSGLLVTPIECDIATSHYADIIARAINYTLIGTAADDI